MIVRVSDLKQTLEGLYSHMQINEDTKGETVIFTLSLGDYYAFAALKIFGSFRNDVSQMQAIGFSLVFTDADGAALDLQRKDYSEVCTLCTELQHYLDWGILSPCKMPDNSVEVALYRSFHTSMSDITLAQADDTRSELLTALLHVSSEFEYLSFVLQHYATAETFDMNLIEFMLQPSECTAC